MHKLEILDITKENKRDLITVSLSNDFKSWFRDSYDLKKWNHMKFQRVFLDALWEAGIDYRKGKIKVVVS